MFNKCNDEMVQVPGVCNIVIKRACVCTCSHRFMKVHERFLHFRYDLLNETLFHEPLRTGVCINLVHLFLVRRNRILITPVCKYTLITHTSETQQEA